jgi:hypothetical protein
MVDKADKTNGDTENQDEVKDPAVDELVDDALTAARGYRRVGELFIAFLAAAPSAAVLTGLIKIPDGSSWDTTRLILGLALAAVAILAGLATAAWLRYPVGLSDESDQIKRFRMARVLGAHVDEYGDLKAGIEDLLAKARRSKAEDRDLKNHLAVRRDVYRLATADSLAAKVMSRETLLGVSLAVVCGLGGLGFLATAPQSGESTGGLRVVTVTLTPAGQETLGCEALTFNALQTGGEDETPEVVPLNTTCTAGPLVKLSLEEKSPTAEKVEEVEPAEPPANTDTSTTGG